MNSFIVINEEFICKKCGEKNPKLKGSCRNHCRKCLYSLHVDDLSPGDRKSQCHSIMAPVELEYNGKKGWMISHKCAKCSKIIKNKAAEDDNYDLIIKLSQINEPPRIEKTRKNRS